MKPIQQWTKADIIDFFKKVDKKTWIKIGAGTAGAAILGVAVVWPAWFKRVEIRNQIKNIESQIATLDTLNKKKVEWGRDKENYLKIIQGAKERLQKPGEAGLLLGAVSRLAKESKVSIVASTPKDFQDKFPAPFDAQYEGSLYDFAVEGGYHDLGVFVSRIESDPTLLRIQLLDVLPKEGTPKVQTASLRISAVSLKRGAKK